MNREVVIQFKGGLGNQLFQYALGRHLALRLNAELLFDCSLLTNRVTVENFTFRSFDIENFAVTGRIATSEDIPLFSKQTSIRSVVGHIRQITSVLLRGYDYVWENNFGFLPSIFKRTKPRLYLSGYWQSYHYFQDIAGIIKQDLRLKHNIPEDVQDMGKVINSSVSVCLHIRRGDFLSIPLHQTIGSSYIDDAIQHIVRSVKNPHFFVFSDDVDWCHSNLNCEFPITFVSKRLAGQNGIHHFYLMSQCQHFITANSTFSWWAAWLSDRIPNKIVVTPARWFSDSRPINDLIPDNWHRL